MKCNLKRLLFCFGVLICALSAHGINLVQEFYLPMPEKQISTACSTVQPSVVGTNIYSIFSIVASADGTVIYYDHWEDGYETDLSHPTQATTKIWGDGINTNGICPGFTNDPVGIPAGTVIALTNYVTIPRNPSQILYDGRDRIEANKALVVARAGWPQPPGSVYGGSVVVPSTIDYDTNYVSPVGQDMTNNLFQYVGMFVMAAQNGTTVTIDPDGSGPLTATNFTLNQGESFLYNGGIKKGATVTATKIVQVNLMCGHINASYAMDWFTLYPTSEWSDSYYTPVGSSTNGQPTYIYFCNPNTNAITINYTNLLGTGSFSVPASNGVYQYQMPQKSGASFTSAGGAKFTALCTVAANPSSDTSYNWGFTLLPKGSLTTEAVVGWGPGSSDGTQDGSPVWVTPLAATRVYVDYKGNHAGPLIDPNGNHYDTNYDLAALQSKTIFDPSKDQTGMRLYTLSGTLISAAWGEDPTVAAPGNPYIDAGTPVLPFPVPILKKSSIIVTDAPPTGLSLGDTLEYTVELDNRGLLPLGNTVVIDGPPPSLIYVTNSTTINGTSIPDSITTTNGFPLGAPNGYTIPIILRDGTSIFKYRAKVIGSGSVSNTVNVAGYNLNSQNVVPAGTNSSTVIFTDSGGSPVNFYVAGGTIFCTLTDPGANTSSNTVQTETAVIQNLTHGDSETVTFTETGTNTGVFTIVGGLPSSILSGLGQQDGILNVAAGDSLQVSFTDPLYGNSCSANAIIQISTQNKVLYLSTNAVSPLNQDMDRVDPVATGDNTTAQSVTLGTGSGTIALVATNVMTFASGSSVTITNVSVSGANRMLLVAVSCDPSGTAGISTMTYSGQAMSLVTSWRDGANAGNMARSELWRLLNPPIGTTNVVINFSASQGSIIAAATVFTGVDQLTPFSRTNNTDGTGASVTNKIVSAAGEQVLNFVTSRSGSAAAATGSNQVKIWGTSINGGNLTFGAGSVTPGAANVTNLWTVTGSGVWSSISVSIKPVGGTNVTTFTQTPVFSSGFSLPNGGVIAITNFVSVTSGSMPASPAITAQLNYGTTNLITLTNASYNSANSNLVWVGALTNTVTIPSGQAIDFVISNAQAGVGFVIDYDSATKPSKIILPTTTVISVNNFGIYDSAYPAGNAVAVANNGDVLYARAAVTDPFGTYDITSLNLNIDGPGASGDIATNLNGANIVSDDGTNRIYEFRWQTSTTVGAYTVSGTAIEGTEGITNTASTSVNLNFVDLGTPSTATFMTAGGIPTNGYPANQIVYVSVQDLDQNTNAATVDRIPATITSSSGDSENVTLVETGPNTGIFTNGISSSTTLGAGANNGTLLAPVGSVLTVNYTDPDDSSDTSSATAVIQSAPGVNSIKMTKSLVTSTTTTVGQTVQFNLQIVNTGSTTLTNIFVTDTFPVNAFAFQSASLTPLVIGAGSLTWSNFGALPSGLITNITVNFTATNSSASATNFASAASFHVITNTSFASVVITHPALTVTKTVLTPTNVTVNIGSNVVFQIVVKNTGTTPITSIPLEDTFSAADFQFVGASVAPDATGSGDLLWNDITGAGSLATNATITIDVTNKVVGADNPANNTATSDFAVDSNGNTIPTASSTTGLTTGAAKITGAVYNDIDQSGTVTTNDLPLSDVSISLYTDPNADGDPSDGTLVQLTTSDSLGHYELLNLTNGNYVVVQTPPAGYANFSPANGRASVVFTNLSTSTNNFFDYQPAITNYATSSGTVWNDLNGVGFFQAGDFGISNVTVDLIQDLNSNGIVDNGEPVVQSAITSASGTYSFAGVVPGSYIVRETDLSSYTSTGDSAPPNDNLLPMILGNGVVTNGNDFFDYFVGSPSTNTAPVAVPDNATTLENMPVTIGATSNDIPTGGFALTILSVAPTNGIASIVNGTNVLFTPANNFVGTATVGYTITNSNGGSDSAGITITISPVAKISVTKSAPATVLAVSNLIYTIVVTNAGPASASNVVASDTLPLNVNFGSASGNGNLSSGIVSWTIGTLAANSASNLTLTVTAPLTGSISNIASATSSTADTNLTDNTSAQVNTTVIPVANLAITKIAPAGILAASNFIYNISVTNSGPCDASGVVVTDSLPAGVSFVNATAGGVNNSGTVNWSLGTLTANSATNFSVTVKAPATGTFTNFAVVSSPTIDTNLLNNTNPPAITTVTPVADLAAGKSAAASVFATSNLTYNISITNFGPSSASGVVVTDTIPAGATFASASGNGANNSGVVTWSLGILAANSVTNLNLTVIAPSSGTLTNTVIVGSPTLDSNIVNNTSAPVITTVSPFADLAITKSAAAFVFATSNLIYTISVTNIGPSSASGVVVTDAIPAGAIFTNASSGGVNNSGIVSWSLGTLAANAATNLTLTVVAPTSGTLTNIATVNSPTGDPTPNNNTNAPVITTVTPISDLGIGKSGPAGVLFNTNFNYTISVTNFGPSAASSISVTDSLPTGLIFVSALPAAATNANSQVIWTNLNLTSNVKTNLTLTVISTLRTTVTNFATVGSPTFDPTPNNNTNPPVITMITNAPPIANPDNYFVAENSAGNLLSPSTNDIVQTPGGTLTIISVSATNGTATIISGTNVSFTPSVNFFGTATIGYTIIDNVGGTNSSLITVTVTNIPPIANPDHANVVENNSITLSPLTNDIVQTPGGALTIIVVNPTNGTAIISGTNILFTPATNFIGTTTVGYTITDGIGGTNSSVVTVTVANIPPIANPDNVTAPENVSVTLSPLTNDIVQTPGGTLAIISIASTNGTASILGGTNILFTPTTNFVGTTTVGYTIIDGIGGTNGSFITITVSNLPPLANPDVTSMTENTSRTINPLANDSVQTPGGILTIISVAPTNGIASIIGGTNVLFTPTTNFIGTATIGYTITDGIGGTNSSLITVTVTNRPPLANPDNATGAENISVTLSPLTNDIVQTPGGTLTIISVSPTNGTASIVGTNILFLPTTNFVGTATVGYTITDGIGGTNSSVVTVTITNIPPLANPDNYSVSENSVNDLLSPLANDSVQTPGGSLAIISIAPTNGTATISGTNVLFTPTTNFLGTATIGYTITDGIGGTNSSLITITVTNRPPIANPDNATAPENVSVTLSPLTNDIVQTPGGTLTIISVSPTNGTASIVGTNVLFTPTTNFFGTATVGYTITDGIGGTNSSVITILVVATPPTANPQSVSALENTATAITLAGSDVNSFPLTFIIVNNPTNGALSNFNTNSGAVTYTPNTNYTGADSFTFRVNNGLTNSASAAVTISILPTTDLALFKTGPTNWIAGSNLTYTITVTNLGLSAATNVVAFDQLPNGFTFVSASPTAASVIGNLVTWPTVGKLAANAKTNFSVTVVSADGGTLTNIAFATTTTIDSNTNNNNGTSTNSQVVTTVTPIADVAIFKSGNTSIQGGGTVTYIITATNSGPSTATNVIVRDTLPGTVTFQSALAGYGLSGNIVSWTNSSLAKGASSTFTVSVTAPATGSFTNVASSTSDTVDSNTNNNNGTAGGSKVTTSVVPVADVQVAVFGPTNVIAGDGFFYTVVVSNSGPSTAANISITNQLPTNIVFVSASGGGTNSNGIVTWPLLTSLAAGGSTNLIINVSPSTLGSTNLISGTGNKFDFIETNTTSIFGTLTDLASAFGTTFDPNLTNNSASSAYPNAQVQTVIVPGVFSIFLATNSYPTNVATTNTIISLGGNLFIVGTSAFNPQTQLYEEFVSVTNLTSFDVHALRLYVGGLRSGVRLYNATGTNNGVPYVEYDPPYNSPLHPFPQAGNSVTFALEFFVNDRRPFTNSLTAVAVNAPAVAPTNGTPVTILQSGFTDTRNPNNIRFLVEFTSIPGRTYTILYSDDLITWNVAVPSVVASATTTFWYDDGPPETLSKPISGSTTRYYRVLLNP